MVHYVFVQYIENDLHNFIEACLKRKPSFSFQFESYEVKLSIYSGSALDSFWLRWAGINDFICDEGRKGCLTLDLDSPV